MITDIGDENFIVNFFNNSPFSKYHIFTENYDVNYPLGFVEM